MAGDWMKVEKATPDKPEIEAMAAALSMDPDAVFGKCFRVWRWFDDHTTDGNAPSVTKSVVDRRAGFAGFADAMEKVGWLVEADGGISLPRFERHNGETSKQRALTSKRVASHKRKGNAVANGSVTVNALPREEKRREEPPPPTPAPPRAAVSADPEWAAAEEALLDAGLLTAAAACRTARDRECTPAKVLAVLEHWRSRLPAWDAGAIATRIGRLREHQPIADLWPEPSPAAVAAETSEARAAHAGKAESERHDAAEKLRVEADRLKRLERDHGPTVDALDRDAIRALAVQCLGSGGEFATKRIPTLPLPAGVVRLALLDHFDSQTARAP